MSSKDKKTKLSKTAKAALPFFALFGGQGFASSRNPLTLQSSKKLAGKSVVYINANDVHEIPSFDAQVFKKASSPFAAFTHQSVANIQNAEINIQSKTMEYLSNNDLLNAKNKVKSKLSGSLTELNRKSFSHPTWTLNGGDPSTNTGTGFISCTFYSNSSNFNYSIYFSIFSANSANFTLYYKKNNNNYTVPYFSGQVADIKAKHYECDSMILPVELQKFEIE